MKKILEINKPKNNGFIFWEHLMRSAVAFIGTYAMLFFGPMIFAPGGYKASSKNSFNYQIIIYLIEHPEVQIFLSVIAIVIINIYLLLKNNKTKYIVKIEYDEQTIQMQLSNLYFTKKKNIEIPTKCFELYIEYSISDDNEKNQKIVFRNKLENKVVGEIDPKHFFWSEQLIQLKQVIQELSQYKKSSITVKSRKPGLNTLLKWNR